MYPPAIGVKQNLIIPYGTGAVNRANGFSQNHPAIGPGKTAVVSAKFAVHLTIKTQKREFYKLKL